MARDAIEEYGVPVAHARWSPEDSVRRQRAREEQGWQRNVRGRTETEVEDDQRSQHAVRGSGPQQETVEEQREDMEEEVQPVVGQEPEPVAGPSNWQEGQEREQEPMAGPSDWQEIPGVYQGDYDDYGDEPEDWE